MALFLPGVITVPGNMHFIVITYYFILHRLYWHHHSRDIPWVGFAAELWGQEDGCTLSLPRCTFSRNVHMQTLVKHPVNLFAWKINILNIWNGLNPCMRHWIKAFLCSSGKEECVSAVRMGRIFLFLVETGKRWWSKSLMTVTALIIWASRRCRTQV